MAQLRDARFDSPFVRVLRVIGFFIAIGTAIFLLAKAADLYSDPDSALSRYRAPTVMPHVNVRGTVSARSASALPPLCIVERQQYQSCGKNSHCWVSVESIRYSNAKIDISWSSAPLPSSMDLDWSFHPEPWGLPSSVVDEGGRDMAWTSFAQTNKLGFDSYHNGVSTHQERLVERCIYPQDTTPVFIEACVSPTVPGRLEACPGKTNYGLIYNGEPEAALDDAADQIATYLGGAAIALFFALLVTLRARRPIMEGLEDRATTHRRSLGWIWAIGAIPPLAGFAVLLMHAYHPPSTWSTGRGGFALGITALCAWVLFALIRRQMRSRALYALEPVLATPRSLLAQASGTVELAVKAAGTTVETLIGADRVAFSRVKISERWRNGKNVSSRDLLTTNAQNTLEVVDESGNGVLDLTTCVLDVEQRFQMMNSLPSVFGGRPLTVEIHAQHLNYVVTEWIIRDGQELYVFGEVSGIALQADESGYRSVRGSPTLGGKDAAPVLVHAGNEQGLVELLTREARAANSYAVVAACVSTALFAALIALALI